ncbi:MAG: hypothetical protein AVDCRST_MAG29-1362 [uncultured Nocardioidaceae bacterium]|uniref:DUF456 domain-containing protein n=1 Tax=uncultured Nocardioidaceae bacterium TaxID=253824 RepID=A0A6J4LSQ5_9ACTN|nr:MAG: hypothetical protein AVDCRST_MAG29-1362 [uncultured Nocardioidaceae bacterium]
MSPAAELLVALAVVVGVLGVVVPVLPGELLIAAAVLTWAALTGGIAAWSVATAAVAVLAVGWTAGWLLGRRHLGTAGVGRGTMAAGGVAGIIGFFVVPVIGLPLGFVAGVYAAERARGLPHTRAWPATTAALRAAGLVLVVHVAGAVTCATIWAAGALLL